MKDFDENGSVDNIDEDTVDSAGPVVADLEDEANIAQLESSYPSNNCDDKLLLSEVPVSNYAQDNTQDNDYVVPFNFLDSERFVTMIQASKQTLIVLTNYRFYLQTADVTHHVPLGLIDSAVNTREMVNLQIWRKDGQCHQVNFDTGDKCLLLSTRLTNAIENPKDIIDMFAFQHFSKTAHPVYPPSPYFAYDFGEEVNRLGFDLQSTWRISRANFHYDVCPSYPQQILIPASISDQKLLKVFKFRSSRRIPVVVWRHPTNGSVIARSSQPEVGLLFWREPEDEALLSAISDACAIDTGPIADSNSLHDKSDENSSVNDREIVARYNDKKKLLIIDARSYTIAVANRTRGGGFECPEYYATCDIVYMNLVNIHQVRKSFQALRNLCATSTKSQQNWISQLEGTNWLSYIAGLLRSASTLAGAIEFEQRPVLVHCSDGWDRTAQIVSLGQLLLDPFYRTLKGFQVLIEREWITFGHKFADRCGQGLTSNDISERSPIFIQWLDCVFQLIAQFPCDFQFNQIYLVKLAQHTYSNLFGSFLCNTIREFQMHCFQKTYSVWQFLNSDERFENKLYKKSVIDDSRKRVLIPSSNLRDLNLWTDLYLGGLEPGSLKPSILVPNDNECSAKCDEAAGNASNRDINLEIGLSRGVASCSASITKTRSCDSLLNFESGDDLGPARRLSDPNLTNMDSVKRNSLIPNDIVNDHGTVNGNIDSDNLQKINGLDIPKPDHLDTNQTNCCENNLSSANHQLLNANNKTSDENKENTIAPISDCEICMETGQILAENMTNGKQRVFDYHNVKYNNGDVPHHSINSNLGADGLVVLDCTIQTRVRQLLDDDQISEAESASEIDKTLHSKYQSKTLPISIKTSKKDASDTAVLDSHSSRCNHCKSLFWIGKKKSICRTCTRSFCSICDAKSTNHLTAAKMFTSVTSITTSTTSSTSNALMSAFSNSKKSSTAALCSHCLYRMQMDSGHCPRSVSLSENGDNSSCYDNAEQITASSN